MKHSEFLNSHNITINISHKELCKDYTAVLGCICGSNQPLITVDTFSYNCIPCSMTVAVNTCDSHHIFYLAKICNRSFFDSDNLSNPYLDFFLSHILVNHLMRKNVSFHIFCACFDHTYLFYRRCDVSFLPQMNLTDCNDYLNYFSNSNTFFCHFFVKCKIPYMNCYLLSFKMTSFLKYFFSFIFPNVPK